MSRRYPALIVFWLFLLSLCSPLAAKEAKKPAKPAKKAAAKSRVKPAAKYLRLLRTADGKDLLAMQTSIIRYVPADKKRKGLAVDLIGAVHVGEKSYYKTLNKKFAEYDVLLYELVAAKGTRIPKGGGGGSRHPVGALQQGLKDILKLEFQLEQVDYTKKNFVHADMSPEEFAKSMKDRDESFLKMMFRMMGQSIAQQSQNAGKSSDLDILCALFSKDRAIRMKRVMAGQFEDLGGSMRALDGGNGSTIITERNKVALKVLKEQIAAGKKKIGIFYGAGHLPDMEKRLLADFKLKATSAEWIEAWNLRMPKKKQRPAFRFPAPKKNGRK